LSDPVISERVRMARELHDGLAQDLAAIGYQIDQLASSENVGNQTRSKLRSLRQGISELLTQVRNDIFELRSDENIKQLPAERVLKNQLDSILTDTGIKLNVKGKVFYNYEIFRIIRELTQIQLNIAIAKISRSILRTQVSNLEMMAMKQK